MSLRDFHIFFIVCSIVLLFGFAYWNFQSYQQTQEKTYLITEIGSIIAGVGLVVYLTFFKKKIKE